MLYKPNYDRQTSGLRALKSAAAKVDSKLARKAIEIVVDELSTIALEHEEFATLSGQESSHIELAVEMIATMNVGRAEPMFVALEKILRGTPGRRDAEKPMFTLPREELAIREAASVLSGMAMARDPLKFGLMCHQYLRDSGLVSEEEDSSATTL